MGLKEGGVIPYRLAYEAKEFCNQGCGFCFATFTTPSEVVQQVRKVSPDVDIATTLTTDEVKTLLIDPLVAMGGEEFQFTGGDPFLRQDLPELVEYAVEQGLRVLVDTNGMIVTQPRNAALYRRVVPQLYRAGVSLDADNEAMQIEMRGHPLSFKAPLRFLEMARDLKPTVPQFPMIKVNTLVSGVNYQAVPGMVDVLEPYIREGIVTRWSLGQFLPMERGAMNVATYQIDDQMQEETEERIRRKLEDKGLPNIVRGYDDKVGFNFIVSPQGIAYVPSRDEKRFVPRSLRNTSLRDVVASSDLQTGKQQNAGRYRYRHPQWEVELMSKPPKRS